MSAMASRLFLNHLFRRRSKKTSKLSVTGLREGKPPVTGGFPSQRASNAQNVSISWRHYDVNNDNIQIWMNLKIDDIQISLNNLPQIPK